MDENEVKLVCFEIYDEKFAFNMESLVEIIQVQHVEITPFFSSFPIIRGMWNYRGTDTYLLDIRDFFGLEVQSEKTGAARRPEQCAEDGECDESAQECHSQNILVVQIHGHIVGLLTGMVLQVLPLTLLYEYPHLISTLPTRYFAGVTIVGTELVLLLALEELIKKDELDALREQAVQKSDAVDLMTE